MSWRLARLLINLELMRGATKGFGTFHYMRHTADDGMTERSEKQVQILVAEYFWVHIMQSQYPIHPSLMENGKNIPS